MSEYSKIDVLCEDRQQEVFARQFLMSCGINRHRLYFNTCPSGKQAGEQYVRQNYPKSVISYRQIANQMTAGLGVLTDADRMTVAQRMKSLDDELAKYSPTHRTPEERIGIFIPKRNIETWIHFLMGETVNEEDEYQKFEKEGIYISFVKDLARNRNNPLTDNVPPSISTACDELDRIM